MDRITWVNGDWMRFAADNDGKTCESAQIVGKRLWPCIQDETIGELYRHLTDQARKGKQVRFNYRCDAPSFRRLFEMQIIGLENDGVEYCSTLLDEEPRTTVPLLDSLQPRNRDLVRVCSWCQRIAVDGQWVSVEDAVQALGLMEAKMVPGLTHGICKECETKMMERLAKIQKSSA